MKGLLFIGVVLMVLIVITDSCGKDRWLAKKVSTGETETIMFSDEAKPKDTVIYQQAYYILLNRVE